VGCDCMGSVLHPAPVAPVRDAIVARPRGRRAPGTVRQACATASVACLAACVIAGALWVEQELEARTRTVAPAVAPIHVYALFVDDRPVPLTVTAAWTRVPHVATVDAVMGDATLWRRMHVADWDMVPSPLRERALDAMLARYRPLLTMPARWDDMTAHEWDAVPQPIRAFAFRHMVQFWIGYYHVGRAHGLAPRRVSETAAAIVMTESWFEHRAKHVNPWGNRDLGLAQASDQARRHMIALHERGTVDVLLTDDDYYDPWKATRFVAIWLSLLLDELGGDLDAAIRAYHRGVRNALRGEGHDYLALVERRRHQYIRNEGGSPSWRHLWERDREITRAAWPWLHSRRVLQESRPATALLDRPGDAAPTWWGLALAPEPALPSTAPGAR
jgi:hypothetical protein